MKFAILDCTGAVLSIHEGAEAPGPEWVTYPDNGPAMGIFKIRCHDGQFVQTSESWVPMPCYDLARFQAYPTFGDQLGAIWKAIAPLIEHPEAEAILAKIQAVKDANPKPSN